MSYLKTNKTIWIQSVTFIILGIIRHQIGFIGLAGILLLLPVLSDKWAKGYMHFLEKTLVWIGKWTKNILFFILFFVIIIPISVVLKIKKKPERLDYIKRNTSYTSVNFEKMW